MGALLFMEGIHMSAKIKEILETVDILIHGVVCVVGLYRILVIAGAM